MRRLTAPCAVLGLLLALATGALAQAVPNIARLVNDLQTDAAHRAAAVQLLPRYGAEAVKPLLPLLGHPDGIVAKAAYNVIWSIACESGRPGFVDQATAVTDTLLAAYAAPELPEARQRQLLRFLAVSVPEGHDVAPIATDLTDETWREPVRTCLERIGTTEARAALRDAVLKADPDFAIALMDSLGQLRDEASAELLATMAHSDHDDVRAAAARALAFTGDPAYLETVTRVWERSDEATRFDATDALLKLADAMVTGGDGFDLAMAAYRRVLAGTDVPVMRDAAVMGLGRNGDPDVVPVILAAAQEQGAEDAAVMALFELRGGGAAMAIAKAYPAEPRGMQVALLPMMGRRGDAYLVPVLAEAGRSEDAEIRHAALAALVRTGNAAAIDPLVAAVQTGDQDERAMALAGLTRTVDALRARGEGAAAGRGYAAVLRVADTAELKRWALAGIVACPAPEGFDAIVATGTDLSTADLPPAALAGLAGALASAGRMDDAATALDAVLSKPLVGQPVADLAAALAAHPELDATRRLGFVGDWFVVGPFPFPGTGQGLGGVNVDEPNINLGATYKVGDATLAWERHTSDGVSGSVNLAAFYGMPQNQVAYAYTKIRVPEAMDAVIRIGSDDGCRLWVNGELVHDHDVDRGTVIDQDAAPAKLKAGVNELLVKISQGGGGWNFCLRVTTPDGVAVPVEIALD
jgi:HEAT repeat protein